MQTEKKLVIGSAVVQWGGAWVQVTVDEYGESGVS